MNNQVYVINGEVEELSQVMDSVINESRFLSDTPNVKDFIWYPLTDGWQVAELSMSAPVNDADLLLLSSEFTSLTIGKLSQDGEVISTIAEGQVEVIRD